MIVVDTLTIQVTNQNAYNLLNELESYTWLKFWKRKIPLLRSCPINLPVNYPLMLQENCKTPLDVLQRRFASGGITTEEYQEKKKILENDPAKH